MGWSLLSNAPSSSFNWTWVIELIVCILLVNWFLFYFNRLFATVISYSIRAFTWHKFRVYVDVQAIQISFLAGRIFFKGVRYHGENETILIQNGYITWRYWLRSSRQVDLTYRKETDLNPPVDEEADSEGSGPTNDANAEKVDEETGPVKKIDNAEARIAINVTGLEWFVYNRTPAYDAIFPESACIRIDHDEVAWDTKKIRALANQITTRVKNRVQEEKPALEKSSLDDSSESKQDGQTKSSRSFDAEQPHRPARADRPSVSSAQGSATVITRFYSTMISLLPIGIECSRGAVLLGNENTRALIVTTFGKAKGHIDAASATDRDIFRQLFDFEIEHPVVCMKPNPEFRRSQHAAAERLITALESADVKKPWWHLELGLQRRKRQVVQRLHRLLPHLQGSVESFKAPSYEEKDLTPYQRFDSREDDNDTWHGLDRYVDDDDRDDHDGWDHIDYARFSTIVDAPAVHMVFYWDNPGRVTENDIAQSANVIGHNVNFASPPAYGLNLVVKGGDVNYGPWADRLRIEIQNVFFPNPYKSVEAAKDLELGEWRQYSNMSIRVDIEEEVSLRVPTKERSKDWQWRGRAQAARDAAIRRKTPAKRHFRFRKSTKTAPGTDVRPFGWLSIAVARDSTVRYEMDMMPRLDGYHNELRLELKDTRATSSVNHALLWRCPLHTIVCDLSNPTGWNTLHEWKFDIQSDGFEMFLLRDHMFLLTDLISDFTAGQKSDYMTFVPYHYGIGLVFNHLKLYLNSNDFNVIDNPSDVDENSYLTLGFQKLTGIVGIPMQYFSPRQSKVLFDADGQNATLNLTTPPWNTLHSFLEDESMGTLKTFSLEGSYNYYAAMAPNLTDSLFLTITGGSPRLWLHGFLIRHLMNVKENYFGEYLHFRTLQEYQDLIANNQPLSQIQSRPTSKKENDLDVILTVRADNSSVLMPANIYSRQNNIRADILLVEADMRFTNYYMDLQVNSSPLEVASETYMRSKSKPSITACQLFIDSLAVFGHRLFGAPPTEPTYVCNWDFDVGLISGECSTDFLKTLVGSIQSFIFTLDDFENALPEAVVTPLHDVTFLRARSAGVQTWILGRDDAFLVELAPTEINFNDLAGERFAKHVYARIPHIGVAVVDLKSALRYKDHNPHLVKTHACLATSLKVASLDKTANLSQARALQQQHLNYHDQRTRRTDWLLRHQSHLPKGRSTQNWARDPPAMPVPNMPEPIADLNCGPNVLEHNNEHSWRQASSFVPLVTPHHSDSRSRDYSRENTTYPLAPRRQSYDHAQPARLVRIYDELKKEVTSHQAHQPPSRKQSALSRFSSPWLKPHFSLENVRPNIQNLPTLDFTPKNLSRKRGRSSGVVGDISDDSGDEIAHMGVLCQLDNGITCFVTPALFSSISKLVKDVQPTTDVFRLDVLQQDVTGEVVKRLNPKIASKTFDLGIRLPFALVRLSNLHDDDKDVERAHNDQYDIRISKCHADCRFLTRHLVRSETQSISEGLLIFAALDELSLSVTDNARSSRGPSSAAVSISDLGFWLGKQEKIKGAAQTNSIVIELQAAEIDQMAGLLHRTGLMIDSAAQEFSNLDGGIQTKHLIYHLVEESSTAADPIFLTRPSYVLRSASNHIRIADSWKILARLRNIYDIAIKRDGTEKRDQCSCLQPGLPAAATQKVLAVLDQWRGWDHGPNQKVPIIAAILGDDLQTTKASPIKTPVQFEFIVGEMAFVLDPGPKQSELTLAGIDSNIVISTGNNESHERTKLTIQTYAADIALNVNWEITRLIKSIFHKINASSKQSNSETQSMSEEVEPSKPEMDVEVIVGADLVSIALATMNLRLKLGAESLRMSVLRMSDAPMQSLYSFTVASRAAMAKLDDFDQALLLWKLAEPKIYGSSSSKYESGATPDIFRLAAACDRLRFSLKQDIPTLIRIVRSVIEDEVKEIYNLVSVVPTELTRRSSNIAKERPNPAIDLHLALFLNDYKLTFAVLPALHYGIAGHVARTSIVPRGSSNFEINFDLKEHEHSFSKGPKVSKEPSFMKMPPINGRVAVRADQTPMSVRARIILEQVQFEAGEVRACFDVVNQPGFLSTVKGVQADAKRAEKSLQTILGSGSSTRQIKPPTSGFPVRFAVDATIEGILIHCSAPSTLAHDVRTDLDFGLGATSLSVHNELPGSNDIFEKPQFHVNIHEIAVGLFRKDKTQSINYGNFSMDVSAAGVTEMDEKANEIQVYRASTEGIKLDLYEETAILVVDITTFLQERIKSITISEEAKQIRPLRRLTIAGLNDRAHVMQAQAAHTVGIEAETAESSDLFDSVYFLDMKRIHVRWGMQDDNLVSPGREVEDLVFSIRNIGLQTRREGSARLSFVDLQLQIVPHGQDIWERSSNSALLPEVIFSAAHVSTKQDRSFAFQAKGKALDLRLAADGVVPAAALRKSLANAVAELRAAKARLPTTLTQEIKPGIPKDPPKTSSIVLGGKRFASLLVDADFAGAVVHITPRREQEQRSSVFGFLKGPRRSRAGRYGQVVQGEDAPEATLQAPGIAFKVGYRDNGKGDPVLNTEIKVAASSNTLYPSVVPLVLEISSSIKEIMGDNPSSDTAPESSTQQEPQRSFPDTAMANSDPTAILGKVKLDVVLWIQRQEFSLSCQPIGRVSATAKFDDIYVTVNTLQSSSQERFFSMLTTFKNLQASVQHVYSRESTASFEVETIRVSLMNSKHVTANTGISAILNISPMKTDINAKQLQDFLLFREIWYPAEIRGPAKAPAPAPTTTDTQQFAIQRYQQIAASGTLPWHAIVSIQELKLQVDFGQGLGKSVFTVSKLWASSKKQSDSEQNLCIGFDKVGADSTGRMSGFVELQDFRVRTSIRWPIEPKASTRAPLVQGSVGFNNLRVKAAFDYQPFAVADVSSFEFLIYNVRPQEQGHQDRLVGVLTGGKIQAFCTSATAAQALALVQAFEKLVQEKRDSYQSSLREVDKYLRRKSVFPSSTWTTPAKELERRKKASAHEGSSLHTDVVVTLQSVQIGAFPNTFFDTQLLKVEATDAQARFAVSTTNGRTHSGLGMTFGQVRVALAGVNRGNTKALGEVSVPDVIERATTSKGGTILRVPRLVASMSTWQMEQSNLVEYLFRSTFEGKVDVGWNYSRISFIRGMWQTHSRALAQRLGKPLPPAALKITAEPRGEGLGGQQEKITAVVNMPQSKFKYVALEPPVIDTPQLRDLGEATPSLEWIGLHRDKLPEATHSVAIVTLSEVAREVEDAYTRILGSAG